MEFSPKGLKIHIFQTQAFVLLVFDMVWGTFLEVWQKKVSNKVGHTLALFSLSI